MPTEKTRRTPSEVDDNIEDATAGAGDDLRLAIWGRLVVEAADGSTPVSYRVVDLGYCHPPQRVQIPSSVEQPAEHTPVITKSTVLDDVDTRQGFSYTFRVWQWSDSDSHD